MHKSLARICGNQFFDVVVRSKLMLTTEWKKLSAAVCVRLSRVKVLYLPTVQEALRPDLLDAKQV